MPQSSAPTQQPHASDRATQEACVPVVTGVAGCATDSAGGSDNGNPQTTKGLDGQSDGESASDSESAESDDTPDEASPGKVTTGDAENINKPAEDIAKVEVSTVAALGSCTYVPNNGSEAGGEHSARREHRDSVGDDVLGGHHKRIHTDRN